MNENATPLRCTAPDPFGPGRCPLNTEDDSGLCAVHQGAAVVMSELRSDIQVVADWPEAPILAEIRWVATEARAILFAEHDPERMERFQARKAALLVALREW